MHALLLLTLMGRMNDTKLTVAQRNDACFELRGETDPEVIAKMRRALADPLVRSCAGTNLRKAEAVEELKSALNDSDYEVRALAARELGGFERIDLLPLLAAAARDRQLVVASNAIEGMANYRDPVVLPYLLDIAKDGGMIGGGALSLALTFHDARVLEVARVLFTHPDISDKLAAMGVLGEMGDANDIAALRIVVERDTEVVSSKGRGFGLMPAISLSRAASTTIAKIEARTHQPVP